MFRFSDRRAAVFLVIGSWLATCGPKTATTPSIADTSAVTDLVGGDDDGSAVLGSGSVTVGKAGGVATLQSPDGLGVEIEVPAGALYVPVNIRIIRHVPQQGQRINLTFEPAGLVFSGGKTAKVRVS